MSSQNTPDIVVNEVPAGATRNPTENDRSGESNLANGTPSSSQSGQSNANNSSNQSSFGAGNGNGLGGTGGSLAGGGYAVRRIRVVRSGGTNSGSYAHTTSNSSAAGTLSNGQVYQRPLAMTSTTTTANCHDEATEEDTPPSAGNGDPGTV
ncbi:hypothetical protein EMPG_13517 [Blastomyces silverae]|uniref:Uncharacterized protein n=1 Tax=Blastomyces silverae TaxID=2060906 RepID=A0A0H1BJI5_9EURO|nr:hypothetical protein EMPG_13517 [Blastomyces silverae]